MVPHVAVVDREGAESEKTVNSQAKAQITYAKSVKNEEEEEVKVFTYSQSRSPRAEELRWHKKGCLAP